VLFKGTAQDVVGDLPYEVRFFPKICHEPITPIVISGILTNRRCR
jgi:hypothetical protein